MNRSAFSAAGPAARTNPIPLAGPFDWPRLEYEHGKRLIGASHQLTDTDNLSWGVGPAIRDADPDDIQYRWSGGLFYDRNGSLLASLMLNGTENLAARLNLYPGALVRSRWFPGLYVGVGDDREIAVGLTWRFFPLGISDKFN